MDEVSRLKLEAGELEDECRVCERDIALLLQGHSHTIHALCEDGEAKEYDEKEDDRAARETERVAPPPPPAAEDAPPCEDASPAADDVDEERRDGEAQEDEEKEGDRAAREPDAKAPVGLPKMIERAGRFLGNGDKEFNAKTFLKGVARLEPPFRAYFHTDQVTNVLFSETKSYEEKAQFLAPCILQLAELYSKGAIGADVKGDTTAVANAADE